MSFFSSSGEKCKNSADKFVILYSEKQLTMTTLDFIILGIIIAALIVGAYKGFVNQIGTITGLILGVLGCRFFGDAVADKIITAGAEHETLYRAAVYALLFIAIFLCIRFVASLFGKALSALHVRIVDRLGGAIFCAAAWLLAMSVAVNVYLFISPGDRSHFNTPQKPWRKAVVEFAPELLGFITTTDEA